MSPAGWRPRSDAVSDGLARWLGRLVCACLLIIGATPAAIADSNPPPPRIASIDWGLAQNLTAMGVPPIAVGQAASYGIWVAGPDLPASTLGLGLRSQPNMELLSQLKPDRILITDMYADQRARLSQIAPVSSVDVYFTPGDVWDNTVAAVKKLGDIVHRPTAAQALIDRTEQQIADAGHRVPPKTGPVVILQFIDDRHVRVFGDRSLVQATMDRMGVANAWSGDTMRWGMAVVPIQRLADLTQGRIVVMDPVPVGVAEQLADSRLWNSLPIVRNAPVLHIPAVWSFGGLPSASRFAGLLADALVEAAHKEPGADQGWPQARETSGR